MNKLLTIFSVLLIVAYANATQKVSYSEIVSSLAQVAHVEGGAAIIESMESNYNESLNKLNQFNSLLNLQCLGINTRAEKKVSDFQVAIQNNQNSIKELENFITQLTNEAAEAVKDQESNKLNEEKLRNELLEDREKLQEQTLAIIERARILRRLSNLVQDELTGSQRNSTVGNFQVDKTLSGYSFVEVHNQLKELDSKDPIVKSMITTLVLITQNKNFANQQQVGKIQAMIEQIIKKDAEHGVQLRTNVADKAQEISKSLNNLSDTMMKNMDLIAEKRSTIAENNNIIRFTRSELEDLEKHVKRALTRKNSNLEACKKVQDMGKLLTGEVKTGGEKFEELKKILSE